ncbi:MAG TPA: DUF2834 domain-containing protein [Myxococcota bacterium]|nr:DUF2834 domain-containing protein [Myxococcota bacterium]
MNTKQVLLSFVLVDFVAVSAWSIWSSGGVMPIIEAAFATPANIQTAADFAIFVALALVWMWRDARKLGLSPLPWVAATIGTGSVGFLAYLIRREGALKVA